MIPLQVPFLSSTWPQNRGQATALDEAFTPKEIRQALTKMEAFKRGGVDEEKAKPYKMIFKIWPQFGMSKEDQAQY